MLYHRNVLLHTTAKHSTNLKSLKCRISYTKFSCYLIKYTQENNNTSDLHKEVLISLRNFLSVFLQKPKEYYTDFLITFFQNLFFDLFKLKFYLYFNILWLCFYIFYRFFQILPFYREYFKNYLF